MSGPVASRLLWSVLFVIIGLPSAYAAVGLGQFILFAITPIFTGAPTRIEAPIGYLVLAFCFVLLSILASLAIALGMRCWQAWTGPRATN